MQLANFRNMFQLFKALSNPSVLLLCLGLCLSSVAHAIEFRSVAIPKAVAMDAPSMEAKKIYIFGQGNPVEVIVDLGQWLKVRDQNRGLSWLQAKQLSNQRTVLVVQEAELKAAPNNDAALLATVEKDVVLQLVTPAITNGWIKVKHRGGLTGYVRSHLVWGAR